MSAQNSKLDRYDEASKCRSEDSDLHPDLAEKNKPPVTTKMDVKKRKGDLDKENLTKQVAKKRKETARDRLLQWNSFYTSKSFGIWVQCTKCNKWRKVMEYEEEHEVPQDWCCSMSISGTKSCDESENVNEEISPVNFVPGTIVWAKYSGYPWWPGMIEDDPNTEEFFWIEQNGKCSYNVTFLDDKVTRAWVRDSCVRPFNDKPKHIYLPKVFSKCSLLIEAAERKAKQAMTMPIQERLKKFSFAHRFKGKWGAPLPSDNSSEDESEKEEDLTQKLLQEMNDIESMETTDLDYKFVRLFELKKNEISSKDNSKFKKSEENRKKLLNETQSEKENKLTNEDDVAHLKVKENEETNSFDEMINEMIDYLDDDVLVEAENDSESFVLTKGGKPTDSKLKKKKTAKVKKCVASFSENTEEDVKCSSKNEKTLMKNSKTKHKKPDKLEKLKENIDTRKNQDPRKPSILKKHTACAMDEIKKENHEEKQLNKFSNSKFKPPVKNKTDVCNNQSSKSNKNKKNAANVNNSVSTIEEENIMKAEMSEKNLDKTSITKQKTSKNAENNKGAKKNINCENKLKANSIAKTLEKNLKNSLKNKFITMQKDKNYANNDSNTTFQKTFNAENNKEDNKQEKKAYKKNFEEALASSNVQSDNKNYNKRSETTSITKKKRNILKANSATGDLSTENSKLTDTSKHPIIQDASKGEKEDFKYEIKNKAEEIKRVQNENVSASNDNMMNTLCEGNPKEKSFSLSLEMNFQESEDSDPFEA